MEMPPTVELSSDKVARFGGDPTMAFAANLKAVQERICGRLPSQRAERR